MTEKFEITGEWFLPTDKENRVHGVLTYDPQDGIDLELYGSFSLILPYLVVILHTEKIQESYF